MSSPIVITRRQAVIAAMAAVYVLFAVLISWQTYAQQRAIDEGRAADAAQSACRDRRDAARDRRDELTDAAWMPQMTTAEYVAAARAIRRDNPLPAC